MSRSVKVDMDARCVIETIASMDECQNLCNDVCCNVLCDHCGDFVDKDVCKSCPLFTKEDGIIVNPEDL